MSGLVWEDPPIVRSTGGQPRLWEGRLSPLRERPGQWARIYGPSTPSATTSQVAAARHGRWAGVDPTEWECAYRRLADDECYIYARFIGEQP